MAPAPNVVTGLIHFLPTEAVRAAAMAGWQRGIKIMKLQFCLIIVFMISAFMLGVVLFRINGKEKWGFVGYQYKWNRDYIERSGFNSEKDCVEFGDLWLSKQSSNEALFTCSLNSRPSGTPGLDVADKVCEYGVKGFIQCRE